jgi:hypothetical protein
MNTGGCFPGDNNYKLCYDRIVNTYQTNMANTSDILVYNTKAKMCLTGAALLLIRKLKHIWKNVINM